MDNYKEKIKKLLSLAQSDNENESKAALLKAQELMIKNKISEKDLEDVKKQKVKTMNTGFIYSSRKNRYVLNLSKVIAENYCCVNYASKEYGRQKRNLVIAGFEDDVEICMEVLTKAVDTIVHNAKKLVYRKGYTSKQKKIIMDSYADGFVQGLKEMYDKQRKINQDEWGLVLVVPKEVNDILNGMKKGVLKNKNITDRNAYEKGSQDGNNFKVSKTHGIGSSRLAICG